MALLVSPLVMGSFCRWRGKAAGVDGRLEGGCRAHVVVTNVLPAASGRRMGVGFGCLQRTAAAGVAWKLLVRCGTASEDSACSNDIMGELGLQRTTAGCSASFDNSGAIHRRKTSQTTTWLDSMTAEVVCVGGATRCCRPRSTAWLF
jgi:hypothetical protein